MSERAVMAGELLRGDGLEGRVTRKLQMRILRFAMLLYMVSFLDRLNVGFAAFTMNKAIGLTPEMFGLGGGLFFIGYIVVQVPSNLLCCAWGRGDGLRGRARRSGAAFVPHAGLGPVEVRDMNGKLVNGQ